MRWSRPGGMDRAGVTRIGRGGATWRVGIGDGSGLARGRGLVARACVLRAGVAARARLTRALECLAAALFPFLLFFLVFLLLDR